MELIEHIECADCKQLRETTGNLLLRTFRWYVETAGLLPNDAVVAEIEASIRAEYGLED